MIKKIQTSAFTLVELLVVVSIVGILASIVYANFDSARASSRDDVRKSSLKELQLAVELYKAQNGVYPPGGCGAATNSWVGPGYATMSCDIYIANLVPDFIAALPFDPKSESGNNGFLYRISADGLQYKIMVNNSVERKFIASYADEFARCDKDYDAAYCDATPQTTSYAVYKGTNAAAW